MLFSLSNLSTTLIIYLVRKNVNVCQYIFLKKDILYLFTKR
nr:MAG TPA: hypothetical protein [Caudoviricetes sp.]